MVQLTILAPHAHWPFDSQPIDPNFFRVGGVDDKINPALT